jgi:hypothetical protein
MRLTMRPDYFVPDQQLFGAADAIVAASGRTLTRDQVLTILGELADIWPDSVRLDLIREAFEDAEKCYA